jgi:hypothetical protein
VTIARNAPLNEAGCAEIITCSEKKKVIYFFQKGWTGGPNQLDWIWRRADGTLRSRPGERQDPYSAASGTGDLADVVQNNPGRWLWIPAFAGMTVMSWRASGMDVGHCRFAPGLSK